MKQHGTSRFKFGDDEGDSLVIRRGKPIKIDVDPADIEINYKGNNVTNKWNIKQTIDTMLPYAPRFATQLRKAWLPGALGNQPLQGIPA